MRESTPQVTRQSKEGHTIRTSSHVFPAPLEVSGAGVETREGPASNAEVTPSFWSSAPPAVIDGTTLCRPFTPACAPLPPLPLATPPPLPLSHLPSGAGDDCLDSLTHVLFFECGCDCVFPPRPPRTTVVRILRGASMPPGFTDASAIGRATLTENCVCVAARATLARRGLVTRSKFQATVRLRVLTITTTIGGSL